MKDKTLISGNQYLQEMFPLGCWAPVSSRKQSLLKRLLKRYQEGIQWLLAVSAIGIMFLAGIWVFLVELAEFGLYS